MPCRTSHEEVHYFLQRNRGMEKRYYYTGKHCECLPTLCHTQNAEKMTRKKPSASWPLFSITPSTLLTDDLLSPRHTAHRCEQVGKGHDTYIPSSITYDLISRNRTITAPTCGLFENEVNICSARKAMLEADRYQPCKSLLYQIAGETG